MAFVVRVLFLSAIAYTARAGLLTGHHDSFSSAAQSAPSASYGTPSVSYGPPAAAHVEHDLSAPAHIEHHSASHYDSGYASAPAAPLPLPAAPLPADLSASSLPSPSGHYTEGSLNLDATLPARPIAGADFAPAWPSAPGAIGQSVAAGPTNTAVGPPRVIGTTVTVGRPIASATRYELQSVIQDVVRRVPVEVTRHVQVAVPVPQPYPVRQEVRVPVPQPYPVHVDVVKHVPYDVIKTQQVEVERPVPYEVIKHVPVEVIRKVPYPVERPYEVIKKVHVPVEKAVEVPVAVWKPYPLHIIKHVTHYKKKKSCCW